MRVLFLFGAGASFGSEDEEIFQPPLGADLFNILSSHYPMSWGKLDPRPFRDFEMGISQLIQTGRSVSQLKREMGIYFNRFEPSSKSLYLKLSTTLSQFMSNITFATLNYERLLERALIKSGIRPIYRREGKWELKEVELCFPHGCCHFWLDGITGPPEAISIPSIDGVFDGNVVVCGSPQDFDYQVKSNALPPVMSYFEPHKISPIGKKFIDRERARYKELIEAAKLIIIIGVRVRKYDDHLWKPIRNTNAKLIYCAGEEGGKEFELWCKKNRSDEPEILMGKFKEHFEEICEKVKNYPS